MPIPHVPHHTLLRNPFRIKNHTDVHLAARKALARLHYSGEDDAQFRVLVVLRIKRHWTLEGVRYIPVCEPRVLNPIPLPNGEHAFLEDELGDVFVLGRPRYKGKYVPRLGAAYHHTYIPYDPQAHPEVARHLIGALDRIAR